MLKSTKYLLVLVLGFAFFLLLLITGVLLLVISPINQESGQTTSIGHFRYLKYNPDTDSSTYGFMDIPKDFSESNEMTYQTPSGSHVLITPLGSKEKEYKCSGTCKCDDSTRRNVGILSRSVIFLASALTSSYAVHLAQLHFQETCVDQFHSSCSSIRSEVDHCLRADGQDDVIDIEKVDNDEETTTQSNVVENVGSKVSKFRCIGFCRTVQQKMMFETLYAQKYISDQQIAVYRENYLGMQEEGYKNKCEDMRLEKVVLGDTSTMHYAAGNIEMQALHTKNMFTTNQLHAYCATSTRKSYQLQGNLEMADITFCMGYEASGVNPSVECVPVEFDK